MINIEELGYSQRKILYTKSSTFKYNTLINSINYFNNLIKNNEFKFLNKPNIILDDIYGNNDYFYDYLENKFFWHKDNFTKDGYSTLKLESLIYDPPHTKIIHDDIYKNLNNIYKNYFSNISEYSAFSFINNNFDMNFSQFSNYLKISFNKRYELNYKIFFPYIHPMTTLSSYLLDYIFIEFQRRTHKQCLLDTDILELNYDFFDKTLKTKLSDFILKNIFGSTNISLKYSNLITNNLNTTELYSIFLKYINNNISKNFFLQYVFMIYNSFIEEYAYILMTKYRELNLIQFNTNVDIYTKLIEFINNSLIDITNRKNDLESIITITYKYRNDRLQFINSLLAVFSDWTDLLIENKINNVDYDLKFNNNELISIINSITHSSYEPIRQHLETTFLDDFRNSKNIEVCAYKYIGIIIDNFIKSDEFKNYILNILISPLFLVLDQKAPKLKNEIYENIDNIINYIKFELNLELYFKSNLSYVYREILNRSSLMDVTHYISEENFYNCFTKLGTPNKLQLDYYNTEIIKFIISMATSNFLDVYLDNFRLLKKFK